MYPANSKTITLYTPLTLTNGSQLTEVAMREPTVRDRITVRKTVGAKGKKMRACWRCYAT